jgi:hypothetical protein
MGIRKFESAAEVRSFLKSHGFKKVSVRWGNNPFGGEGKFMVKRTDLPDGISLITSSGSQEPTRFSSDDGGQTAKMLADLRDILKGTNAFVIT